MIVHSQQMEARAAFFAEAEAMQGPLPPSERDLEIFERVVVEAATTRQAAHEFELSQTRIVQIRDRVAAWIASTLPELPGLSPRQRLRLAAHTAEARLDHLYSLALTAFQASQGTETIVRTSDHGETTITRNCHGDIKYLSLASRLAERKYAVAMRGIQGAREVEKWSEAERDGESQREGAASREGEAPAEPRVPSHVAMRNHREADTSRSPNGDASRLPASGPPVRDCSRFAESPRMVSPSREPAEHARADETEVYDEIERRRRAFLAALADDTSPVQPPRVDAGGMLIDEPEEGKLSLAAVLPMVGAERSNDDELETCPEQEASHPAPRLLSRRERRARQRMLQKKLKMRRAK
jgi:hypothetical protein